MQSLASPDPLRPQIAVLELIAMVGCLMALNALSIDILLPALSEIGHALGAPGNDRQTVITSYVFGFGLAQLGFGPLSDALGRRKTLLISLVAYLVATVLCLVSQGLWALVAARALQGVAAAATRVIAVAIVRDLVSGRRMAEIMSFAMTVFTVAPILAPSIGQLILFSGDWRAIFIFLFVMASVLSVWMLLRLPETLHPQRRIALRLGSLLKNYALAASNRITLGYLTASCFIMGALFAFIATSEQVLAELYQLGVWFPIAFAVIAIGLAGANMVNAKIVRRLGMRRISHVALLAYLAVNGVNTTLALFGQPPFFAYFGLLMASLMLYSMIGANFSALAMEPAGDRAGTAAALHGSSTAMAGAVLGSGIGQSYNGSVLPITLGFTVLGAIAFLVVLWTEKGKLFGVGEASEADN